MMNRSLSDSNDHVPVLSADDGWDQSEEAAGEELPATTVLPARRTVNDPSSGKSPQEIGLRIESNLARSDSSEAGRRIEVQEIGSSVVRLDQTEPAPAKVERLFTFHERPAQEKPGKNQSGEGRDWGAVRRHPVLWILGMGVAVTVLVVSTLLLLPLINSTNAPTKNPGDWALRAEEEEKVEGMEALNQLLTQHPEALQIFRAYAQASLVEEVLPLIKDGKALEKTIRGHWEPLKMPSSWAPEADSAWGIQVLAGRPYGILDGVLPDHRKFAAYFTWQSGRLLMDWKATVAFGTATFEQLGEGKGDATEVRGEISASDYYSAFWPEAEYRSYRLTSPDQESSIWCYVRRGEAAEGGVAPLFNGGVIIGESQTSRKITLRLVRGSPESLPNQWLIGEMLHVDWATP